MKFSVAVGKLKRLADEFCDPAPAGVVAAAQADDTRVGHVPVGRTAVAGRFGDGWVVCSAVGLGGGLKPDAVFHAVRDGRLQDMSVMSFVRAVELIGRRTEVRNVRLGRLYLGVYRRLNEHASEWEMKATSLIYREKPVVDKSVSRVVTDEAAVALLRGVLEGKHPGPLLDRLAELDPAWEPAVAAQWESTDCRDAAELLAELTACRKYNVSIHTHGFALFPRRESLADDAQLLGVDVCFSSRHTGVPPRHQLAIPPALADQPARTVEECDALLAALEAARAKLTADRAASRARAEALAERLRQIGPSAVDVDDALAPPDALVRGLDPAGCWVRLFTGRSDPRALVAGLVLVPPAGDCRLTLIGVPDCQDRPVGEAELFERVARATAELWAGEAWVTPPADPPRSWKVGVKTAGDSDWCCNGIRHPTREDARRAGSDLYGRWTAVREWAVLPSDDPVHVIPAPAAAA